MVGGSGGEQVNFGHLARPCLATVTVMPDGLTDLEHLRDETLATIASVGRVGSRIASRDMSPAVLRVGDLEKVAVVGGGDDADQRTRLDQQDGYLADRDALLDAESGETFGGDIRQH